MEIDHWHYNPIFNTQKVQLAHRGSIKKVEQIIVCISKQMRSHVFSDARPSGVLYVRPVRVGRLVTTTLNRLSAKF